MKALEFGFGTIMAIIIIIFLVAVLLIIFIPNATASIDTLRWEGALTDCCRKYALYYCEGAETPDFKCQVPEDLEQAGELTIEDLAGKKGYTSFSDYHKECCAEIPEFISKKKTIDSDGDGMHDDWETQYGLNPNDPSDGSGTADADGDGVSNIKEYEDGTNPKQLPESGQN